MCRNDKPAEINSETKNTYCCEKHDHKKAGCDNQKTNQTIAKISEQFKQLRTPQQ